MIQRQYFLTLWLCATVCLPVFAQNLFQRSYDRVFSEQILAVEALPNGHFAMAGFSISNSVLGRKDIWVMRVNGLGEIIWSKIFQISISASATAIQKTMDGNLLLAYTTFGQTASSSSSGWLKISADGAIIWAKKAIGNSILTNISPSASGGYLLCGQNITAFSNQYTGLVVRIGEDGEIQWSSVFGENGSSAVSDCWEDALGFIHCCGYTSEDMGNSNGFWAKMGADGELVGPVQRFGSPENDELTRIVPMGADRLLLSGYTNGFGNSAYSSVWALVCDYSGEIKSSKTFSLLENNLSTNDMIGLPGDQFLLALSTGSNQLSPAILMKLSVDLDQLFAYQYKGGSESDNFKQVVKAGTGFASAGTTFQNGDANAYLVVTSGEGKLDNDDCCPKALEIERQDVVPQMASFVPTQTAFYAVQNVLFSVKDEAVNTTDLCQPIELEFTLSQDTICPGECVDITPVDSTSGVTYTFEYQGGTANPDAPGQVCHTQGAVLFITRKGANNNCEKSLTKSVGLGSKKDNFPNAFTPNGDGANDVFRPVFGCPANSMRFQIFNRWGKKVFETIDPNGGWDGKFEGIEAASDVYVWKLEYEVERSGNLEKILERGDVTLLR